ncbi:cysteine desulfurase family protein [Erwinia sp. Leaf53]|uniref:cysteine desulfurase family protein n=1 Tax=Erwinia sp. Leaf53 TaxID=1736225 RepID=UPI0006FBE99B|nr:cysteine desulfurase family protein [Erwinia sp. Leaf53]KQN64687.1 cysteine desulfurase IscS [Erwinia sp. Leaf53]
MNGQDGSVYLDNNATTALDDDVLEAMMPYLTHVYGNAASISHVWGLQARKAVENAREIIASAINAYSPGDIIFTSGATESVNLALFSPVKNGHVITSQIEHKAVLDSCARLESAGMQVSRVAPDCYGIVLSEAVSGEIRKETRLVSIMSANNETGALQPINEIGKICREQGVVFHCDATQSLGKIALDVRLSDISLASFSAHKIYGPKGVGALYISSREPLIELQPMMVGGGHENGLRSGTLNVAGIVGFAHAVKLAVEKQASESARIRALRNRLWQFVVENVPEVRLNGHPEHHLPGVLNLSFSGIDADSLLLELPDIALSAGSACTSARQAPSHVLKAMGLSDAMAQASIRIGIGRFNTEAEISYVCQRLKVAVEALRAMNPVFRRSAGRAQDVQP